MRLSTAPLTRLAAVVALGLCAALPSVAQDAPVLGDEFVFFVEGVNSRVPNVGAVPTQDPNDADNTVLQFFGGNFAGPSLSWPPAVGVDITANQASRDSVFFKLRVGPGASTETDTANVYLMFLDSESINSDGNSLNDDVAFRLIWPIPRTMFDGETYDIVLPLPPATAAALEAAKGDTTTTGEALPPEQQLDELAKRWTYQGGFNPDGNAFLTPGADGFEEFDYANVFSFGFFWDQGAGPAGSVFVDDFYIGSVNTDLSSFSGSGSAYAGSVNTSVSGDAVTVSFTGQDDAGAYRLYAVTGDGADVTDPDQALLLRRFTDSADLSLDYRLHAPHPSISDPQITFAVTIENDNGIENTAAVYQTATFENAPQFGYVFGMTADQVDGLFGAFENSSLDVGFLGLDGKAPFRVDAVNGTSAGPDVAGSADFAAEVYMGFAADPDDASETIVMVYADVTDDVLFFAQDDGTGLPGTNEPFLFDRLAVFFGTYNVPFPVGSPHGGQVPGEDYALNMQPVVDTDGNVTTVATLNYSPDLFGAPLFELKSDGTGWRMLTAFLLSETSIDGDNARTEFARPADDEIGYFPLIVGADEQDGPNADFSNRNNIVSSERPNVNFVNPGWYASPLQWTPVAWAGSSVVTSDEGTLPTGEFALAAPYPNPTAGVATVNFALAGASVATLEVYDLLGRRVARIGTDQTLPAGPHTASIDTDALSAGLYLVRLTAGDNTATQRLVVVR